MSDPKSFLSRWSRRKWAAARETSEQTPPNHAIGDCRTDAADTATPPESRPTSAREILPPVESIDAHSNIRVFLAAGVPADLKRAALRRAWSSDPTIRDFVGLSENSWDFNSPTSMAGFGPIDEATVRRLLSRILEEAQSPTTATAETEQPAPPAGTCDASDGSDAIATPTTDDTARNGPPTDRTTCDTSKGDASGALSRDNATRREQITLLPRRRHGGALPQ